jgi:hypothetical protein
MPPFGQGVDADSVRALFIAGMCTAAIAETHGVGQRRVQQLVADLRPEPLAEPDDEELSALIIHQQRRLGSSYGTQMMEGALYEAYPLLHCSRRRILNMLRVLYPLEFKAREDWARQRLERAHYEGHHWMYSVHLDFDGKLQEYGLYVGSMVEGVSRAQMALVCVTTKIPLVAYLALFLPFVLSYGFPEQLITDKGGEWILIVFVCNLMQECYRPHLPRPMHRAVEQSKCAFLHTLPAPPLIRCSGLALPVSTVLRFNSRLISRFNTRVEKFNYEINVRVFIPVRKLLNMMEAAALLDKDDPMHVGAFSALMQPLVQVGLDRLTKAWNHHRVKGVPGLPGSGGRPCERALRFPNPGQLLALPLGFDAVAEYEMWLTPLRREPEGAAAQDRLYGQPAAQQHRAAAVALICGGATIEELWEEILAGLYTRFVLMYVTRLNT